MANSMTDGMSFDEREEMIAEEMNAVRGAAPGARAREEKPPKPADSPTGPAQRRSAFVDPNDDGSDVLVVERGRPFFNGRKQPPPKKEEDDEEEPVQRVVMACEGEGDGEDPSGEFTAVNYDGTNEGEAGIYLHLSGDPMKALDNCAIPIFLSIGDRTEITQILGAAAFTDLLKPLVQDVIEDREMIRREMAERYSSSAGSDAEEDGDGSDSEDEDDE